MTPLGSNELSRLRRSAEELFARAEQARDQGRLGDAARLFGRSAALWKASSFTNYAVIEKLCRVRTRLSA